MYSEWHLYIWKLCFSFTRILYNVANREPRYPRRVSHNIIDTVEIEWAFYHNLSDEVRQRFVKMTTNFSYNRRCHPFSYSSSRLDPHSDYRRFLIGREKPLCIFSLPSTSLRQSSLTARGRKLYALRMASEYWKLCFIFTKILCIFAKQ